MMGIVAVINLHMQGYTTMQGESPQKFADKLGIKGADFLIQYRHLQMQVGPVGKIQRHLGQCFIHGQETLAITADLVEIVQGIILSVLVR